jgi:hypothetical protein
MEVPAECGLIEAGSATVAEWKQLINRHAGFFNYDPDTRSYCMITIPAPWRDTPGPTWQLVAAAAKPTPSFFRRAASPSNSGTASSALELLPVPGGHFNISEEPQKQHILSPGGGQNDDASFPRYKTSCIAARRHIGPSRAPAGGTPARFGGPAPARAPGEGAGARLWSPNAERNQFESKFHQEILMRHHR